MGGRELHGTVSSRQLDGLHGIDMLVSEEHPRKFNRPVVPGRRNPLSGSQLSDFDLARALDVYLTLERKASQSPGSACLALLQDPDMSSVSSDAAKRPQEAA